MNAARSHIKGAITPRQIKAIHAALHKSGVDDDTYRAMLANRFGAMSCKTLTWRQAEELLEHLNGTPPTSTRNTRGEAEGRGVKYADLDGRPGYASGAQCRFIAAMFSQVTRAEGEEAREKALNSFCTRICGVAGLRMVRHWHVQMIIKALESMGAVKPERR